MQVILLDKINNLGNLGEQVNVKAGYARNYLVPNGKAVLATKKNIRYIEACRTELESKLVKIYAAAEERATKISALGSITIAFKAGNEGKLFGSVGTRHIAAAITSAGVSVIKSEVRLPKGLIRTIGNYDVNIQVRSGIFVKLNVLIVPAV